MYIKAANLPIVEKRFEESRGVVRMLQLATRKQMLDHARQFSHAFLEPGCTVTAHKHSGETEIYYFLKGKCLYNDNGTEIEICAGDVTITGDGEYHGIINNTAETLEFIALVILE